MFYIGIDAGGTKTALYAATKQHGKRFEAIGEGINFWRTEEQAATRILTDLINQAVVYFKHETLGAICGGFAGASHVNLLKSVEKNIGSHFNVPTSFLSDAVVSLEAAFGAESGILAVIGTGSNILGKTQTGAILQTGGWGWKLGDEGSGLRMAIDALSMVSKAIDNNVRTALRHEAEKFFQFKDREGLLNVVYRANIQLQKFAPVIIGLAQKGDKEAKWLLHNHAQEIAVQINRLWQNNLDLSPRLAFSGGLVRTNLFYKNIIIKELSHISARRVLYVDPLNIPTFGAWQIAQQRQRFSVKPVS